MSASAVPKRKRSTPTWGPVSSPKRRRGVDAGRGGDEEGQAAGDGSRSRDRSRRWSDQVYQDIINLDELPRADLFEDLAAAHRSRQPHVLLPSIMPVHLDADGAASRSAEDRLHATLLHACHLDTDVQHAGVPWLYAMLRVYAAMQPVMRERPEADLRSLIATLLHNQSAAASRAVSERLDSWCIYGLKLSRFVDELGPGCLFYLSDFISPNRLHELRVRRSDGLFQLAVTHLHTLRLAEHAGDSGAAALGRAICDAVL